MVVMLLLTACGDDGLADAAMDTSADSTMPPSAVWMLLSPTVSPPARESHAMAYDQARQRVVVFGGFDGPANGEDWERADTWEFDGSTWTEVTPASTPPARTGGAAAFDAARGVVVLFGGIRNLPPPRLADTWEYDGTTWNEVTPATSPTPRVGHCMTYDEARHRVVLFSGDSGPADTWEYDGTTWTETTPSTSPPARGMYALAYDAKHERVILFGGGDGSRSLNDTWAYDGSAWEELTLAASPPARFGHALVYDAARERIVLFGGYDGSRYLNDTWELDGSTWTEITGVTSPSARSHHGMVYDATLERVVLFGGDEDVGTLQIQNDTWVYGPP
jgi:hypothetical protein